MSTDLDGDAADRHAADRDAADRDALAVAILRAGAGRPDVSPYPALRRITAELGGGEALLATDQARLRALLEVTAAADPRLFHVMFLHHCMTIGAALDYGALAADVAELAQGRSIGAALMTELGRGNSSAGIRTEAVLDRASGEFVLHTPAAGAAKYPPNVGEQGLSRLAVVSARLRVDGTDRGVFLFLVALRDEHGPAAGVTIGRRPPTALLPLDYATVRFDGVRVPGHRWLADGAGFEADGGFHDPTGGPEQRTRRSLAMSRFAWGAVTAGLAAAARAAVAISLSHALRRITTDRAAGDRPALELLHQQRLLFGAAAAAQTATVLARRATAACWRIPPGGGRGSGPPAEVMRGLALTKAGVDRLADQAVARCRSAAGALGFFSENRLIEYQALTMAFHSAGGDNRLILLDAARAMAESLAYRPPAENEAEEEEFCALFRARERLLHAQLTDRLSASEDAGVAPTQAWDDHSGLALLFAEAHLARTTAETLETAALEAAEAPAGALLRDLGRYGALEEVSVNVGWFLTEGLLTPAQARALPDRLDALCRRLLPRVGELVELMATPRAALLGPLAAPDYVEALT
ncbi:acyl-CoA oxidase [Kitasatospora sp. GAS204A]|uniref:acyl-CoA dehydrogenase n=1 Tax=unclassified Kitasatospora TaxID=2633591 RepID=UPI002476020F|nr:acyl-CoA dehydrogenase [Kitasatospora sp. GAS204B]MDH6122301.1 acyl-CoA oxidase [Kitasatospora sp. GAS204B]